MTLWCLIEVALWFGGFPASVDIPLDFAVLACSIVAVADAVIRRRRARQALRREIEEAAARHAIAGVLTEQDRAWLREQGWSP